MSDGALSFEARPPTRARGVGEAFSGELTLPDGRKLTIEQGAPQIENDRPIRSIAELSQALAALGWPAPTEITPTGFRWAVAIDGKTAQIAAWYGPEMERVEGIEDEPQMAPTGRSGIFVTGERAMQETLGGILAAFARYFERCPDELLKLFGLKHDHGFPKSPVVPLDFNPNDSERGELLRLAGYS
jgi:hypothetical protein